MCIKMPNAYARLAIVCRFSHLLKFLILHKMMCVFIASIEQKTTDNVPFLYNNMYTCVVCVCDNNIAMVIHYFHTIHSAQNKHMDPILTLNHI